MVPDMVYVSQTKDMCSMSSRRKNLSESCSGAFTCPKMSWFQLLRRLAGWLRGVVTFRRLWAGNTWGKEIVCKIFKKPLPENCAGAQSNILNKPQKESDFSQQKLIQKSDNPGQSYIISGIERRLVSIRWHHRWRQTPEANTWIWFSQKGNTNMFHLCPISLFSPFPFFFDGITSYWCVVVRPGLWP